MLVAECGTQFAVGAEVVGGWAYRDVKKTITFVVSRRRSTESGIVLSAECRA